MAGVMELICPTQQLEYFCARDWTGFCNRQVICPSRYFVAGEKHICDCEQRCVFFKD
jgi:hypothetical protein